MRCGAQPDFGAARRREELAAPEALAAWVRQCGPCGDGRAVPVPSEGELREARALREAVYALVVAALGPGGPAAAGAAARTRLNRAAAMAVPTPRLSPSGDLVWQSDDPVPAMLALIARDALDLVTSPSSLSRVRPCGSAACGALFLDHSRPGTRRWCSMDTCGNQAKKAGLRARA